MPESKPLHRVRIEGNGLPASTRITDAETGQEIGPVAGYDVTHRANEMAHATIYLVAPKLALECDATVVRPDRTNTLALALTLAITQRSSKATQC